MITRKQLVVTMALAFAFGFGASAEASRNLNFTNNATPAVGPLPFTIAAGAHPVYTASFAPNMEFRMINPATGLPGIAEKSVYGGGRWVFGSGPGVQLNKMTGADNLPSNPGAQKVAGSAAPGAGTNPATEQNASFKGFRFNFLAPAGDSKAATKYGQAEIVHDGTGNNYHVHFNVLEMQWNGYWFPLGQDGGVGVDFKCTGAEAGATRCYAEHKITAAENPGRPNTGLTGWVLQWEVTGNLSPKF
jgi:hypothetical protein